MKEYKKYPSNAIRVCIDQYEEEMTGRAYTPLCAEEVPFTGVQELLIKLDNVFDESGYPQTYTAKRTFHKPVWRKKQYQGIPEPYLSTQDILNQKGSWKTFDVIINTRRNASWQGILHNKSEGITIKFNGELELLKGLAVS